MRARVTPLLIGGSVLLGLGCHTSTTRVEEPAWGKPQTSVENVIDNLRRAVVEKDPVHYAAQFADSFTFVFAPQDVGLGDSTSWDLPSEVAAMTHMFTGMSNEDGYVCEGITLGWEAGTPADDPVYPRWKKVVMSNVVLTVSSRSPANGDPLSYLVRGDQAYLWFEQTGLVWRLIRWEDKPITGARSRAGAAALTQNATFGAVKRLWR